MSKTNKILLVFSAVFFALVVFELVSYIFSTQENTGKKAVQNAKVVKTSSTPAPVSTSSAQTCLLDKEEQESCKKYSNIIREMNNIERDLKEKTLNSVTMTYSFTVRVNKIESPCTKDYGGYPLKPDLCIESPPKQESVAQGKTKVETIYKFVGKPNITVFQKKNNEEEKIKLGDIKTGDIITITSVHDMSKGNKTPFFNYDNVIDLKIVRQ